MKLLLVFLLAAMLGSSGPALAQIIDHGGGTLEPPTDREMPESERIALVERLGQIADSLRAVGVLPPLGTRATVPLEWPIRAADHVTQPNVFGLSNFVDHNPAFPNQLLDFNCGTRTYDTATGYNHQGLDLFLWPFWWAMMDNEDVEVVAAAPGVILFKQDGQFDRRCSFNSFPWNAVYLAHDDGSITWYGHLKNGSVTTKAVGEAVAAGERLGFVGSSGSSTGPHLHFEVYAPGNVLVDPYAGACNAMNETSLWVEQPSYYLSAINAIKTHSAPPVFPTCPATTETINEKTHFEPGETVLMAVYYRDQRQGQLTQFRVRRPMGTIWFQWTHSSPEPYYNLSYWYWTLQIPNEPQIGVYTIEAVYEGQTYTQTFTVGSVDTEAGPAAEALALDVFPNPAGHSAHVALQVRPGTHVRAAVYDLLGREVLLLHDAPVADASVSLPLATEQLAPGLYVVRARTDAGEAARRFTVLR